MEVDNKVVIIAVVAILAIAFLSGGFGSSLTGAATKECSNDVDGDNPFSSGSVIYFGKVLKDICMSRSLLLEYYCKNGKLKYKRYPCENGCSDGVCVKKEEIIKCTDSDGGKDYYVKGSAYGMFGGEMGTFPDSCCSGNRCDYSTGDIVLETYCEGQYIRTELYKCPNGCSNRACISVKEQGWDISIKIQKVEKRTNENALDWYYSFSVLGNRNTMPNFNLKIDFIYPNGEISIINIPHEPADMACGECPTQGGVFSLNPSRTGNYVFKIFADSENSVSEIKEENNYDSLSFYWDGSSVGKVPFNCIDSDGLNIGKKGTLTYGDKIYYDFCRSGLVVEYYCVGDNDFSKTEYSCPIKGFSCINGECIPS